MGYVTSEKRVENDLSVLWPYVSMPRNIFELYYGDTLSRFYAEHPSSVPFPFVEHILRLKSAYIIPENVSIETRFRVEEQWVFALFILGLARSINLHQSHHSISDAKNWLIVILDERSLRWIGADVGLPLIECLIGNFSENDRVKCLIDQAEDFSNTNNNSEKNFQLFEQIENHISELHSEQKLMYNRASASLFSFPDGFFIYKKFFKDTSLLTRVGYISNELLIDHILATDSKMFGLREYQLVKGAKKKIIKGYFLKSELPSKLDLEMTQDFIEI